HRGLVDHDAILGHVLADGASDLEHVLEVRGAVLVGRRAYGDELKETMGHAGCRVGRERESPGVYRSSNHRLEARLVDRQLALLQLFHFRGIDVHAKHRVTGVRKASPGDKSDVARSEYCYSHPRSPLI